MSGANKRYILLISIHGLIRGQNLELGRDADTGGQTKYVLDLARGLAESDGIGKVDLVTRRVKDSALSEDYAKPVEQLSEKARIIRIEAGPDEYIPKEQLWDHLDSVMDNIVNWLNDEPQMPDLVHSHYADAGYVGVRLSNLLSIPLIHTGHSLGRDKRKRLLANGASREEVEQTYNIARRIEAEEEALANADLVIASTQNEIEEQYGLYNYYDPSRMTVIPPGTDLQQFYPPQSGENFPFLAQLELFLREPEKPIILALSRPDERKNILTLLQAYGESAELQQRANLLIVAGSRDDISDMEPGAQSVLTNILLVIDSYNLYGKVALPKRHLPGEVPEIYRMVAARKGVFINPALTEPFGLTILEAAACGLPVVATENGGPVDIIENCQNGLLVDPLDKQGISDALLEILGDEVQWSRASENGMSGVQNHYTWEAHTRKYLKRIEKLDEKYVPLPDSQKAPRTSYFRDRAIFSDLDQNLLGDEKSLHYFSDEIRQNRKCVTFGIATGRRLDSALSTIKKHGIPMPDVLISSLGTRIHYGKSLIEDTYWKDHIDHDWNAGRIKRLFADLPGLKMQSKVDQSSFKVSYYYDQSQAPTVDELTAVLRKKEITANLILSFGQYLDIVPSRASKGQALRYVAQRLDIPLEQTLVAGGSGADEDMMRGNTLAVVVSNRHNEELSQLEDQKTIYFAGQDYARGILEAIEHYDFFSACMVPSE